MLKMMVKILLWFSAATVNSSQVYSFYRRWLNALIPDLTNRYKDVKATSWILLLVTPAITQLWSQPRYIIQASAQILGLSKLAEWGHTGEVLH